MFASKDLRFFNVLLSANQPALIVISMGEMATLRKCIF